MPTGSPAFPSSVPRYFFHSRRLSSRASLTDSLSTSVWQDAHDENAARGRERPGNEVEERRDSPDGHEAIFFKHNEQYRGKTLSRDEIESDELLPEVEETFKRQGKVAFDGIKERRLIFGKSEVQGLDGSALFHQLPDRKIDPFKHKHIVDTMKEKELRRFVSKHINKGEWHVILQFVSGLLGGRKRPLKIYTNLLPVEKEKRRDGFTYWPTGSEQHLALTMIILYEHEENEFRASCNSGVQNKSEESECGLAPSDCTAVIYVLKNVQQISCIDLSWNDIGSLGCVEIRKLLDDGNGQLTELNLSSNNIDDIGLLELRKVITNSKITLSDLGKNEITDVGVKNLCDVLSNPHCKLTLLDLLGKI